MLKKIVPYAFIISIFCSNTVFCMATEESAFVAMKNKRIIQIVGNCDKRHPPFSSFKAALARMAFEENIFESKDLPIVMFNKEYMTNIPWYNLEEDKYNWCKDQTPESFMANSALWVSHQITANLGKEKFQEYVKKFNYGNMDVSTGLCESDILLKSWLGGPLEISPHEQVAFVSTLLEDPNLRSVMDRKETWGEWKLYGKTGGGNKNNGWFVGWIEKEGAEPIIFAQYLDLDDQNPDLLMGASRQPTVGLTAKDVAKMRLKDFWQE